MSSQTARGHDQPHGHWGAVWVREDNLLCFKGGFHTRADAAYGALAYETGQCNWDAVSGRFRTVFTGYFALYATPDGGYGYHDATPKREAEAQAYQICKKYNPYDPCRKVLSSHTSPRSIAPEIDFRGTTFHGNYAPDWLDWHGSPFFHRECSIKDYNDRKYGSSLIKLCEERAKELQAR